MENVHPVSKMMSTMSSEELVRERSAVTKSGSKSLRVRWECSARGSGEWESEMRWMEKSKEDGADGAKSARHG